MEWAILALIFAALLGGGWLLIRSLVSSKVSEKLVKEDLQNFQEWKKRNEEAERNRPHTVDDAFDRL